MVNARQQRRADTPARILDVAERLAQQCGFNGFSYADVAAELHITTASLHYHFAGKAELGRAMVTRYTERFAQALVSIEARLPGASERLMAYAELYAGVLREQRLCLCGMLAAEYQTLPEAMRASVLGFFDDNEAWLTRVLEDGRAAGQLRLAGSPRDTARMIVGGLEGALLLARPYGDIARFQSAAQQLLQGLSARAAPNGTISAVTPGAGPRPS
jgi:TetR/AcrR family transcriptional regulator, transcriptional repressor for nem operon